MLHIISLIILFVLFFCLLCFFLLQLTDVLAFVMNYNCLILFTPLRCGVYFDFLTFQILVVNPKSPDIQNMSGRIWGKCFIHTQIFPFDGIVQPLHCAVFEYVTP